MFAFPHQWGNKYKEKYSKHIPLYPSKKDISIKKTNGLYNSFNKYFYRDNILKLQNMLTHLPYIPIELWDVIFKFQYYLEDKDEFNNDSWLYSEYSKTPMLGMNLRTRQLYLPNIYGIILNQGLNIINISERAKKNIHNKNTITLNLSKEFLNYITRWFHWLNKVSQERFDNLIDVLKVKSKQFLEEVDNSGYQREIYENFYYADYFINTYYENYKSQSLTYRDFDFEIFIFENTYYNRVYKKGMLLRNYKRINLFLHE